MSAILFYPESDDYRFVITSRNAVAYVDNVNIVEKGKGGEGKIFSRYELF